MFSATGLIAEVDQKTFSDQRSSDLTI